tara:strand:- start:6054 stop:7805 length:1752 start_codon:yes stop_codon:yes gene_type:complete
MMTQESSGVKKWTGSGHTHTLFQGGSLCVEEKAIKEFWAALAQDVVADQKKTFVEYQIGSYRKLFIDVDSLQKAPVPQDWEVQENAVALQLQKTLRRCVPEGVDVSFVVLRAQPRVLKKREKGVSELQEYVKLGSHIMFTVVVHESVLSCLRDKLLDEVQASFQPRSSVQPWPSVIDPCMTAPRQGLRMPWQQKCSPCSVCRNKPALRKSCVACTNGMQLKGDFYEPTAAYTTEGKADEGLLQRLCYDKAFAFEYLSMQVLPSINPRSSWLDKEHVSAAMLRSGFSVPNMGVSSMVPSLANREDAFGADFEVGEPMNPIHVAYFRQNSTYGNIDWRGTIEIGDPRFTQAADFVRNVFPAQYFKQLQFSRFKFAWMASSNSIRYFLNTSQREDNQCQPRYCLQCRRSHTTSTTWFVFKGDTGTCFQKCWSLQKDHEGQKTVCCKIPGNKEKGKAGVKCCCCSEHGPNVNNPSVGAKLPPPLYQLLFKNLTGPPPPMINPANPDRRAQFLATGPVTGTCKKRSAGPGSQIARTMTGALHTPSSSDIKRMRATVQKITPSHVRIDGGPIRPGTDTTETIRLSASDL